MEKVGRYFAVFGALLGGIAAFYLLPPLSKLLKVEFRIYESAGIIVLTSAVFAVLFFFTAPPTAILVEKSIKWLENRVTRLSLQDIAVGVGGLIIGLIIANLIAPSLAKIPIVGSFLPSIALVILGYIGISVARSKKDDILALSPWRFRQAGKVSTGTKGMKSELSFGSPSVKLLDTSTIIDGRIADICKTGFIEGPIVIPTFVLDELRRIADSSDNLKRNKGRRGLDILNVLQKDVPLEISIQDWKEDPEQDVDFRLLKMAKALGARIITTDFNLAKIAEFQEVGVLNINQLANALKPIVSAGEELPIHILKEGKEPGQGVGYLEDGTMVVVEQARRHIGETITVVVTNCHTTPAGRMIFARPKYLDKVDEDD
ncbi:MAG TPA: TRAM domain-containing protein [Firmicutes bacterium]|nr:TRAM domain-containing protein [Candidatus Fermentithermobacillaceae bacterium]